MKCCTKQELAYALNVSCETLRKILNVEHYASLQPLGYKKNNNYIYGKPLEYVKETFCLTDEDFK